MPTQLEIIVEALERNGRPMTAEELGQVLRDNGSDAERPENNVSGLVSTNKGVLETSKVDGVTFYSLALGATSPKKDKTGVVDRKCGFEAFRGLCARLAKARDGKRDWNEEEAKQKLVLPFLRFLGYEDVADMDFEENVKGRHADITVRAGRKKIFVEVKRPGVGLDTPSHQRQLLDYVAHDSDSEFGILTDGCEWIFFFMENGRKPVLFPVHCFRTDSAGREDFEAVSMFSRDAFNARRLAAFARDGACRVLDGMKGDILGSIVPRYSNFPDRGDVAKLREAVADVFDRWRKKELNL